MPTNFIAVIDGTGDYDDQSYARSMANSFCKQIADKAEHSFYQRGPSGEGFGVRAKAHAAADWLRAAQARVRDSRLFLSGYSRGGSAAIYAAELLEETNTTVNGLFLFDAVARHIYSYGEVIPANVAYSRHAVRNMRPDLVQRYEGTITAGGTPTGDTSGYGNPMRTSFGNTGLTSRGSGDHAHHRFLGSHGALGGVGFRHVTEDVQCQIDVANRMTNAMNACGLAVTINSFGPAS